ncbi:oxidoreductase-like domain-containing protein [Caballeronia sp. BCC1704]|uniref:oxidoreductase-like domain-containing protein n=1 Tax=Caballeronia sp. BCC1704 TaxID=2676300 RepID=UPI001FC7DE9C|nr:oxidoreductase-like domain-containing protein [Caballeronia sp. BCC1704]
MNRHPSAMNNHNPDAPPDDPRPTPPERPAPGDCCQSGCNPCVFDIYQEALERYQAQLRDWEARHARP